MKTQPHPPKLIDQPTKCPMCWGTGTTQKAYRAPVVCTRCNGSGLDNRL